jgi:hypothetical protein
MAFLLLNFSSKKCLARILGGSSDSKRNGSRRKDWFSSFIKKIRSEHSDTMLRLHTVTLCMD